MSNSVTYGKYIFKDSNIHLLNPIYKVLSFVVMIIICFFLNSYIDIIMMFSYLVLCIIYSDIDIRVYLKELSIIKYFLLFILVIDIISLTPIVITLSDIIRVIFIYLYYSLFMKSTSSNEIITTLQKIFMPFNKINEINISLNIFLVFKFPYVFLRKRNMYYKVEKERKVVRDKNIKNKILKYKEDIVSIYNISVKELNKMKEYYKLSLYGYGKSRTNYKLNKNSVKEVIFVGLNIMIFIIVIFYK